MTTYWGDVDSPMGAPGEGGGEGAPLVGGEGAWVVGEDLNADMVGTSVAVLLHTRGDRRLVAPHDEGVHEAVAAAACEVVVGEALSLPVVRVVRQVQVCLEVQTGDLARLCRVSLHDDALLAGDE